MNTQTMFRGDHKTINLRFTKDNVAQNITGWTIYFTAKRQVTYGDSQAIFQKSTVAGTIVITDGPNGLAEAYIVPVDTSGLEDLYVSLTCDVQAADTSGKKSTTGYINLMVNPDVTRDDYSYRLKLIAGSDLLQYIPLWEPSGATAFDQSVNGRNGAYSGANVVLGQTGIGDRRTSMFTSGSGSFCNLYSNSLRDAFNWHEFTVLGCMEVANAGVWADGILCESVRLATTGTVDYFYIRKEAVSNSIRFQSVLNGTAKGIAGAMSLTNFIFVAATQSKASDQFKAYVNGAQFGSTQTGLGTQSVNNMAEAYVAALSSGAGFRSFQGYTAHFALVKRALTLPEIRALASP